MRGKTKSFLVYLALNLFIVLLLSFNYNKYIITESYNILNWIYLILAIIGHYFSLTLVTGIVFLPLLFIKNLKTRTLAISFFISVLIMLMYIDTLIFHQYRFHLNGIILNLFFADKVIEFPAIMYFQIALYIIALLAFEYYIYYLIQVKIKINKKSYIRKSMMFFVICVFSSHIIHIWGSANFVSNITNVTKYLPLYYPTSSNSLIRKLGLIDEEMLERQKKLKLKSTSDLNYPKNKLIINNISSKYDIIFIVIDSWRFDTLSEEVTPNILRFTKNNKSLVFNNHFSAGNSTRTGIFGLFYGLPGTYWHSFYSNGKSPLLIDRLQGLDYQIGIYASAQLYRPEFNKTVFVNIPNLRVKSSSELIEDKDIEITKEWIKWYDYIDNSKPSFSFLFYDSPHSYTFKKNYSTKFKPMVNKLNFLDLDDDFDKNLIFNRYKTSVHFTDSLIGQVIKHIDQKGKKNKTLIVITGDHGQEMNDNNLNYWGHNSNFTKYQVKVPLIIITPNNIDTNKKWIESNVFTSHVDIVPTIMKNILGVNSTVKDYSTGVDLFGSVITRDWVFASSYSKYAIIDKNSITEIGTSGLYEVLDLSNRKIETNININNVNEALKEMSSFYK